MDVLITGGTGTISSGLVQESVNVKYKTYAITRGSNNKRNIEGAQYFHADIWNQQSVTKALGEKKFDVIVECLAYNVQQLQISLENFAARCEQYIFVSTAGVYNKTGNKRIKETDEKDFNSWMYTKDKIECEKYLKLYAEKTGLKYTIIRPTVTYGDYRIPFPIATRNPGWTFFDRMKKENLMLATENVLFSVIHIEDFSKMVVALFGNAMAINEDFHITSDENDIYWDDVMKESGKIIGITPKIIHVSNEVIKIIWPDIYDEIAYHKTISQIFDSSKIKRVSRIKSGIDLSTGIKKTITAMEKEYIDNNLSVDKRWNDYCNATIYYAYLHEMLSDNEMQEVSKYVNLHGTEVLEKSLKNVMKYNKKSNTTKIKHTMKK